MTDLCRLCGDYKPTSTLTSTLDIDLKTKLEIYFRITIDCDKYLPNSICSSCCDSIDKSCLFVQRIVDVQERLKNDLLDQLNSLSYDEEFGNFEELKIERLDRLPDESNVRDSSRKKRSDDSENNAKPEVKRRSVWKRNRGIKMSREVVKFTMENLFKDELSGKFTSDVEYMQIPYADKEMDGKLSEQLLTTLSTTGWFNYEYKCVGCEGIFTNVMDLEKHSIKCTKKRCVNSCQPCLKEFPSYSTFVNHITEKHHQILKYSCIVCSEFRWSFVELHNHICESHEEHSIFLCLYCGKNFFTGALLRDHIVVHRPDAVLPEYFCDLCDYKTNKKQFLLSHMSRFHLERRFTCECCAFSFKYRAELVQHQQSQHSDECNEECRVCGKMFKNKRKLRRHVKNMHEENPEVINCEICGKSSKSKKLHKTHMKVHSDKESYQCMYCDRTFKHSSGFTYHVRTHTGERPYTCPVENCDLKFIDWPNCRKHARSKHGYHGDIKPVTVKPKT